MSNRKQKKIDKKEIKQYELNRKTDIVRKQNEENREIKNVNEFKIEKIL